MWWNSYAQLRYKTQPLTQQVLELATQQPLIIFTSMNAVEAVAAMLQGRQPEWQIACIGQTTLQLAQEHFTKSNVVATRQLWIGI
jgi:hypothetical protein